MLNILNLVDWLNHNINNIHCPYALWFPCMFMIFLCTSSFWQRVKINMVVMPLDRVPLFFIHRAPASHRHRSSHPQRDGKRRYRLRHAKHLPVARVAPVHRPTRTRTPPVGFGEQRNIHRLECKNSTNLHLGSFGSFLHSLEVILEGWLHMTSLHSEQGTN